jgi:hypothetical protein
VAAAGAYDCVRVHVELLGSDGSDACVAVQVMQVRSSFAVDHCMLQAAAAALQMSGSIAPDAQLCAARVALFRGSGSGSGPIVCVDPSHVEEMSSDALVTAAGAAGGSGAPLQLTAVRVEARSGMGDDEVRVVMQAVCDALRGQMVEGSEHSVKATVPPPPPPPSQTPPTSPHVHPPRAATTTTTTLASPPSSSPPPPPPSIPPPPTPPRPPVSASLSPPPSAASATEAHTVPPRSGAKIVGPKVTCDHSARRTVSVLCTHASAWGGRVRSLSCHTCIPGLSGAGDCEEERLQRRVCSQRPK